MWSRSILRPIPLSERIIQVNIARKIRAAHWQKKNLDVLYRMLAPGSRVGKISTTASIIKKPNRPEVRVGNSDIAKLGTRHERDKKLGQYINRRPKTVQEKTLEQKIINLKKDLLRKDLGSKKTKRTRKQPDDISIISLGRSCISSSSNVARALKIRIPKQNPKLDVAFRNGLDLKQFLHFSLADPITAPPTQPSEAGPFAPPITLILKEEK